MPQPLKKFPKDLKFSPDALTGRPLLAVRIARVSAAWTDVEIELSLLLASALDANANAGMAMYLSLIGTGAQESAFKAALKHALPLKMAQEVSNILTEIRTRAGERNRIVHCIWGITDDFKDGIIHCWPVDLVRDQVAAHWLERNECVKAGPSQEFVTSLSVYKERDFVATEERIAQLKEKIKALGVRADHYHQRRRAQAIKRANARPNRPSQARRYSRKNGS